MTHMCAHCLSVTEPAVPDLRLLSSAHLCAFPVILPSFSLNSLFRLNEANISYVYLLVYLSLYNTPVFASRSHFSFSLSLSLSLSPFSLLVLRLPRALKEPCPALGTKSFLVSDPFHAPAERLRIAPV